MTAPAVEGAPDRSPIAEPFGTRLRAALDSRGPLCVGIDPHAALLRQWGLDDDVDGVEQFTRTVVEALAGSVAVLKPQAAFYERFGSRGMAVLERWMPAARAAGALVLLDAKRGDIGSTMAAYAEAYLDPSAPMAADALTVSPYLGVGALQPAFDTAAATGTGVFVLALTSNPEGADVQLARTPRGTVAEQVLGELAARNAGAAPLGSFGAVVGATLDSIEGDLAAVNGPLLAPGLGAQGATAAGLPRLFGDAPKAVVPVYARSILAAGPDAAALRAAAEQAREECAAALGY